MLHGHRLIYYCAYAKPISVSSVWTDELLREFKEDLKGLKVSKSAIQLPLSQPLSDDFIGHLVRFWRKECLGD